MLMSLRTSRRLKTTSVIEVALSRLDGENELPVCGWPWRGFMSVESATTMCVPPGSADGPKKDEKFGRQANDLTLVRSFGAHAPEFRPAHIRNVTLVDSRQPVETRCVHDALDQTAAHTHPPNAVRRAPRNRLAAWRKAYVLGTLRCACPAARCRRRSGRDHPRQARSHPGYGPPARPG